MTPKTYIQTKDLPDSPKGTRWSKKHPNSILYYSGDGNIYDAITENDLISNPDFWEVEVKKRWKPEEGEKYFFIYHFVSEIYSHEWIDDLVDNNYYNSYNCFKTREEAESVARKVLELLKKEGEK